MVYETLILYPNILVQYLEYLRSIPSPKTHFTLSELNEVISPEPQAGKALRALLDYLLTLRVIEVSHNSQNEYQVSSDAARKAIHSLFAFADDGIWDRDILSEIAWHKPPSGWDISGLIQLEHLRVEAAARTGRKAQALREQESALVIVKGYTARGAVYLLTQRKEWPGFSLIGGKFEPQVDRDLEDTARRETEEELGLRPYDFTVEALPLRPVYLQAISQREGVLTDYKFRFFQLFATKLSLETSIYKWFCEDEIKPQANLSVETFGHLAYPEIQRALWQELPGGLGGLPFTLKLLER